MAMGVFVVGVATIGFLVLDANASFLQGSGRLQATLLAEEGLGAAHSMRDADFDNLTVGIHGIALVGNVWVFSGGSDIQDQFIRAITVSDIDVDTKRIESTVTWTVAGARESSVTLVNYLTDWKQTEGDAGEQFEFDTSAAGFSGLNLTGIALENVGTFDITVDKIIVYWTDPLETIRKMFFNGVKVWGDGIGLPVGGQVSGTEIDIEDFTMPAGSGIIPTRLMFSGKLSGGSLAITFIMAGDASTKFILLEI